MKTCACLSDRGSRRSGVPDIVVSTTPDDGHIVVYDAVALPADACRPYLGDEEKALLAAMPAPRADAFATARFVARAALGSILDCAPWCPVIETLPEQRPQVFEPRCDRFPDAGTAGIGVGFAYTESRMLIGVAPGRRLGVDLERVVRAGAGRERDIDALAETFFAPEQRAELAQAEGVSRTAVFYRLWCRQEAFLKATGEGLVVPADPRDPAAEGFTVLDLQLGDGFAAAIAASPPEFEITLAVAPKPPGQ